MSVLSSDETKLLKEWAAAHREDVFADRKTLQLAHGEIGFRLGQPRVAPRSRVTWASVLERIERLGRGEYVRIKREVDKDALLADREQLEASGELEQMGLKTAQTERFFAEPKQEEMTDD